MLQRIQSIWLLLAASLSALSTQFSFFSGNRMNTTNEKEWVEFTALQSSFTSIIAIALTVAALVTIFMYKDRKRQLMVTVALLVVSGIQIALYYNSSNGFTESKTDLTSLISFAIPVFFVLAAMGIYKDEQLVKNADRLR